MSNKKARPKHTPSRGITVRQRASGRWEWILRLKGHDARRGMQDTKDLAWEQALDARYKVLTGSISTLAKAAERQYKFQDLIDNYRRRVRQAKIKALARIANKEVQRPIYIYGSDKILKRSYDNENVTIGRFEREEKTICYKTLDLINTDTWQNYINKRLRSGDIGKDGLYREISIFRTLWKYERKELGLPERNIFKDIDLKPDNVSRERPLKPGEYRKLFNAIGGFTQKRLCRLWTTLLLMALNTAMRRGELLKLLWQDIDFDALTITVPAINNKSLRSRLLPMTDTLRWRLAMYRNSLAEPERLPEAKVFSITASALEQAWTDIIGRAGLWLGKKHPDNLHFHDLKHTALSNFATLKPQALEFLELIHMGAHAPKGTTFRYLHTVEDMVNNIREKLETADNLFNDIDTVEDFAFDRYFHGGQNGEDYLTDDPLPDVEWIKRSGKIVMDVEAPRAKAFRADKPRRDLVNARLSDRVAVLRYSSDRSRIIPEGIYTKREAIKRFGHKINKLRVRMFMLDGASLKGRFTSNGGYVFISLALLERAWDTPKEDITIQTAIEFLS